MDCATKRWIHNINFNNIDSWVQKRLPCPKESVIFPVDFRTAITFPNELTLSSIILSTDAYFLLNEYSRIVLIGKDENEISITDECKNQNGEINYKNPKPGLWMLSKNWEIDGQFERNLAIPHQEMIPCDSDSIIFPDDNNYYVDIQDIPWIFFKSVHLKTPRGTHNFADFVSNVEIGRAMFLNHDHTMLTGRYCYSGIYECACHAKQEEKGLMPILCENEKEFCEIPMCVQPIRPIGHCCDICGAMILIDAMYPKKIDDLVIEEKKKNSKYEKLYTHFSRVNIKNYNRATVDSYVTRPDVEFYQIIAVDRGEYKGLSSEFLTSLVPDLDKLKSTHLFVNQSGDPYNPTAKSKAWAIFLGTFFVAMFVFTALYLYYEKSNDNNFSMTNWIPNFRLNDYQIFRRPFVFARFDNSGNDGEYENITVNMGEATSVVDLSAESAFKNPIYDKQKSKDGESGGASGSSTIEKVFYKKKNKGNDDDDDADDDDTHTVIEDMDTIEIN